MHNVSSVINIAQDFSRHPGGRFRTDGDYSGERFRDEILAPALKTCVTVEVDLDGTLGYGSGFLEEAFGGAVRVHGLDCSNLTLFSRDGSLLLRIVSYTRDAQKAKGEQNPTDPKIIHTDLDTKHFG